MINRRIALSTSLKPPGARLAFTLIELLVVIAIISLLVSILLPSLATARNLAKNVACMSRQRTINMAIQLYCSDNEGYYPTAYMPPIPYYNTHMSLLRPYDIEPGQGAYVCPSDEKPFNGAKQINIGAHNIEGDYSYNYNLFFGGQGVYAGNNYFRPRKIDEVTNPSRQVLLIDGEVGGNWFWFTSVYDYNIANDRHSIGSADTGFNIALADGAVTSVALVEVTNLESQGGDYIVWPIN